MNKDLKNLLQLVIKTGIQQGILGQGSRVCRKPKVKHSQKDEPHAQDIKKGKEE